MAAALFEYSGVSTAPVRPLENQLAFEIGVAAKALDLELAAYLLSTVYTLMLPEEYRTKFGVFYTPPGATHRLLDMAESAGVSWKTAIVGDIACGGGAFLAPVACRMLAAREWSDAREAANHLARHLKGFELDPFSAWMSEVFVAVAFASVFPKTKVRPTGLVSVGDSLNRHLADFGEFDLVIGNPPYGKVTLPVEERQRWSRSLYGHANLYGLFTDLAIRLVRPAGGVVAYVTPASFLGGQYFQKLRALLSSEAPVHALDFLHSRDGIFADVLQETVLVALRRGKPAPFEVSFTKLSETQEAVVTKGGWFPPVGGEGSPWLLPRSGEQAVKLAVLSKAGHRLSDYGYEVSTGPLVWNRHKPQLKEAQGRNGVPIVWAECIDPKGSGAFTLKAEGRGHVPWYVPNGKDDPNIVSRAAVLVQRTTSKEQQKRVIAAVMSERLFEQYPRVAVENHINMVRPHGRHPALLSLEAVGALLNSEAVDVLFRCTNGSTAVSAYELESIPLPPPAAMFRFQELVRRGANSMEIEKSIQQAYANVRTRTAA